MVAAQLIFMLVALSTAFAAEQSSAELMSGKENLRFLCRCSPCNMPCHKSDEPRLQQQSGSASSPLAGTPSDPLEAETKAQEEGKAPAEEVEHKEVKAQSEWESPLARGIQDNDNQEKFMSGNLFGEDEDEKSAQENFMSGNLFKEVELQSEWESPSAREIQQKSDEEKFMSGDLFQENEYESSSQETFMSGDLFKETTSLDLE